MSERGLQWLSAREIRNSLDSGVLSGTELITTLLARIQELNIDGPAIRAVIETNPDAPAIAERLESALAGEDTGRPLRGVPVLLKDNIDTADSMLTTAGSLALIGSHPQRDAFVAQQLRKVGAIILGKANMSEWANFRSTHSSSGWSARGGQALNPYALDRSPCGSSSGSASAVAAGLVPAAIGTETDGSILCPAGMCGVVGIKPTVGLVSRSGVIPISSSQDTVGPIARTVEDAAVVLGAISGVDPLDPATTVCAERGFSDYTQFLDSDGLRGARMGVPREIFFGYSPQVDAIAEAAISTMGDAGAVIVDPANIPSAEAMKKSDAEMTVLLYEFKAGLNRYLQTRVGIGARSLEDVIAFNSHNPETEMPYFGQEIMLMAQEKGMLTDTEYTEARAECVRLARDEGIDRVLKEYELDALIMPTTGPAFTIDHINGDHFSGGSSGPAAVAGYPGITVPAGMVRGLPVGMTFVGPAFSEPVLLRLAFAFEQLTHAWRPPQFMARNM